MRWRRFPRSTVWLFALLSPAFSSLAAAPPAQQPTDAAAERKARQFLAYVAAVRAEVLRPEACPFDPAAVVFHIGADPDKLAAYVREHVRYEPYAGVVRGAEGTLAAGSGGDWDRAVLLRALLTEAGYATSLKVIDRSASESAAVVDAFLKREPLPQEIGAWADPDLNKLPPPPPVLARFNIPANNRIMHWRQATADWRRNLLESLDAADAQVPVIRQALSGAGSSVGAPFEQWRAPLLAGAGQRVVVVLSSQAGERTLSIGPDATEPDPAALSAAPSISEIPADQVATLTVRLTLQPSGADAKPVVVLERAMPLTSLFRTPPRLEIVPSDEAAAAKPATSWTAEEWFKFVSGFNQFQAILRVGHDTTLSRVFDLSGQLHDVEGDGRIAGAGKLGGAVASGFGGGLGGDDEPAQPPAPIEALTLGVELNLPKQQPLKSQRLLFGKLRPGVSPVGATEILATGGPVQTPTELWLALDAITADAPLIAAEIRNGGRTPPDAAGLADAPDFVRIPAILHDWQLGRSSLANRIVATRPTLTTLAGPSVILRNEQLIVDAQSKRIGSRTAVDVVFDQQRLLPRNADAVATAVDANQRLGVASTVLESALLNRVDPAAAARGPFAASVESIVAGRKPAVRAAGAAAGQAAPLAEWAVARNERERVMIFTGDSAARCWWAVDPATGAAIGRGDGGEGQSYIEYLNIIRINLVNLKCCLSFAKTVLQGEPEGYEAMACLSGTDNPGTYIGGAGNVAQVFEVGFTGGFFAQFGDCLYGIWDYYH